MSNNRSFNDLPADLRIQIMAPLAERDRKAVALTCKENLGLFRSRKMFTVLVNREMNTVVPWAVEPKDFYALRRERKNIITYLLALHCKRMLVNGYQNQYAKNSDEINSDLEDFRTLHAIGYNDEMLQACNKIIAIAENIILVNDKRKELEDLFDDIVISKAPDSWLRIQALIAKDAVFVSNIKEDVTDLYVMSDLISAIGRFGAIMTLKAFDAKKATVPGLQLPDYIIDKILHDALKFCQIDLVKYIYSQGIPATKRVPVTYANGVFETPQLSIACGGLLNHTRIAGNTNFVAIKCDNEESKLREKIAEFRQLFDLLIQQGVDLDERYETRAYPVVAAFAQAFFGVTEEQVIQHLTPRECFNDAGGMMSSTFHISAANKKLLEEAITFTLKVTLAASPK